jgi:hypothetical protein
MQTLKNIKKITTETELEKIAEKYKEDEDFVVFNKLYRGFKYDEFYLIPLDKLENNFYIKLLKFISGATFGVKFRQIARVFGENELRAKLKLLIKNFKIIEYKEKKYKVKEEGEKFQIFLKEYKDFFEK